MLSNLNHISAALRVCIDRAEDGCFSGRIFSQRLTKPLVFHDVWSLLLQMDDVLDQQEFPKAFQRLRTFHKPRRKPRPHFTPAAQTGKPGMTEAQVAQAQGAVTTFHLYVVSRHNTTWQGSIDWLNDQPPQPYTSALEFVKLADATLFPS